MKTAKNPPYEHYDIRYKNDNMWDFLGNGQGSSQGQWSVTSYPSTSDPVSCGCEATYTCFYGATISAGGWHEICDKQRWAIDNLLEGLNVYHYAGRGYVRPSLLIWCILKKPSFRNMVLEPI